MPRLISIKLWDLPTRAFHWMLVIAFCTAWFAGEYEIMWLHFYAAYIIMTLVIFRIFWGLIGSSTSRFSAFMPTPSKIKKYLPTLFIKTTPPTLGHNPLGALSIFAMLGLLGLQLTLGLFSQDSDFIDAGPLADLVSTNAAMNAMDWHEDVFHLTLVVIALHVAAIWFYRFYKGDNLVKPMITGNKLIKEQPDVALKFANPKLAVLTLSLSAAITWGIVSLLPNVLGLN